MQVDGVFSLPAGDEDDGSLFGSPPPSPARGRSPQLALPAGPGSAENVGTIALPGSHPCSELAIDPAALLLNRPLPTRKSDTPTPTPLTTTTSIPTSSTTNPLRPLSTSSSSSQTHSTSRRPSRAPRNSKNGKERSTTPHPRPPIHFPDPNDPLPSNFLRSQQALLGHAGLIGGLDPSALSTRYHKGATSRNPIVVEDELDPPPLGKKGTYSLDSSSLPSPSSQEVVSSLIKQKNIFPVLESLVRLLSGTGTGAPSASPAAMQSPSPPPSSSTGPSNERITAPKRRRLNTVPAGAADWDVPYPFQQGEGPSQYRVRWEKERLKQILSQLAVLIKGARRSAAARTYFRQHADSCPPVNPPRPPDQIPFQEQPITGISISEQQDTLAFHCGSEAVAFMPTISPPPPSQTFGAPQTASLDNLLASLYNSIPSMSSPLNPTSFSPTSAVSRHPHPPVGVHADALDADLEQLLAMLHHTPSSCVGISTDSPGVEASPVSSAIPADQPPPHGTHVVAGGIPDSVIDPMLLGGPFNSGSDLVEPSQNRIDGQGPSTPTLLHSPIASTSSLFDPLTPTEDFLVEPDIYRPEQGRSQLPSYRSCVPQELVNAIAEDPINAAALLLQIATSGPSLATAQPKSQLLPFPASRSLSVEPQSPVPALSSQQFAPLTATTTPISSRASSTVPIQGPTASAVAPAAQILSLLDQRRLSQGSSGKKLLSKQELIQRAKDRRQQLLSELEKAKVELWEATIEQGVLSHLMKDYSTP